MKLELGKTYLTRDGRKMKVINKSDSCWKPFVAKSENGHFYTYSVLGWSDPSNDNGSPSDLVAEYMPEEKPMKLEVGKAYTTKSGHTVEILKCGVMDEELKCCPACIGHMIEPNVVRYWSEDGVYLGRMPEHDILGELDLKPETKPDPPKIVLKFGRKYKTRDGSIVEIRSMNGREPYVAIGYFEWSELPFTWGINGNYFSGKNSDLDIVEEM